jgi:hypothetical protein
MIQALPSFLLTPIWLQLTEKSALIPQRGHGSLIQESGDLIPRQMQGTLHCFSVCTLFLELHARCWWTVLFIAANHATWSTAQYLSSCRWSALFLSQHVTTILWYMCAFFSGLQPCTHAVVSFCWTFQTIVMIPSWPMSFYCHNVNVHARLYSLLKCLLGFSDLLDTTTFTALGLVLGCKQNVLLNICNFAVLSSTVLQLQLWFYTAYTVLSLKHNSLVFFLVSFH